MNATIRYIMSLFDKKKLKKPTSRPIRTKWKVMICLLSVKIVLLLSPVLTSTHID